MAIEMTYQVVFDLFQKQNGAVNELWRFYSGVALALLAAAVGSDKLKATRLGIGVVIAGFWMFSLANLFVLVDAQALAVHLASVANSIALKTSGLEAVQITTTRPLLVAAFHLVCDASLTVAIVVVSRNAWASKASAGQAGA